VAYILTTGTGAGFNVSNNYIGGNASDGTGTYVVTMPTGTAQYLLMDLIVAGGAGTAPSSMCKVIPLPILIFQVD
jgi:hypothetical protein